MSRRRKNPHHRDPLHHTGRAAPDLRKLIVKRQEEALAAFIGEIEENTGYPREFIAPLVGEMMLSNEDRQCASCLALHKSYATLSWFFDPETEMAVIWNACSDCMDARIAEDDERLIEMAQIADTTLNAWISGSIEPQGLVVMINPSEPPQDDDDDQDEPDVP